MKTNMNRFKDEQDTKSAILEMKKFKVLCQAKSAKLLGSRKSDKVYKRQMEQMASDIKFYEKMCREMIQWDVFYAMYGEVLDESDNKRETMVAILASVRAQ